MESVKLDKILEECEEIIARYPTGPYFDIDDACLGDDYHSSKCRNGMVDWSQPCLRDEAEKAKLRRDRLRFLPRLKECARDPSRANGQHTLEGLAQESCIYDVMYLKHLLLS